MNRIFCIILLAFLYVSVFAQNITGVITDAKTGDVLPYVNIHYEGRTVGSNSDYEGKFSIPKINGGRLTFSYVGYTKQTFKISANVNVLNVKMNGSSVVMKEAVIKAKKKRYTRKDNPAVALMRKVIEMKKARDVKLHDFFSYDQYRKTTLSINEFSEKVYSDANFKSMPFLKNHVEVCPETGKLILPVSVTEETSKYIYRKQPSTEKTIVNGKREEGVNQLIQTGDIMNVLISDCFTDVDIYKDNIRLLQYPFISPISTHYAISFYHYFIADTLMVENDKCIEVDFAPSNPQDFGFTGSLYIFADSTYRVRKATINIPRRSDVNYVENLNVDQEFITLPSGEQVVASDKMIVQMKIASFLSKFQVERSTYYSNYSIQEIPKKEFKFLGPQYTDPNAMMRDEAYWNDKRPVALTKSEDTMDDMIKSFQNMKNFKIVLLVAKAFIENFVETSTDTKHPSKVDFGPVNTIISQNFIDGLRLRASAQTTANLNPHLFAKGYLAYGFKDERWKGQGEMTYSFNEKAYLPREFPTHNLTLSYQSDVMSPSDKYLPTDKDNVFTSFKWNKVDQMMYFNRFRLRYEKEFQNGFRIEAEFHRERDEGAGAFFYQSLDGTGSPSPNVADHIKYFNTSDLRMGVYFQPHAKYINTKQRRLTINKDSPCFSLYHTIGFNGFLGGQKQYNLTEAGVYKRFWIPSAGKIDIYVNGGIEWNKVPYPLLIMPAANLSYVIEDETFNMINNMEFLNDRYASMMFSWDLNGKLFNRVPLLRKLKWREYLGCNILWGKLSDRNNPFLNPGDSRLYYFPGHFNPNGMYEYSSYVMNPNKPYYELIAGIHNIFKVIHVEVVRRMNYLDNSMAKKWGFRFMFRMTF